MSTSVFVRATWLAVLVVGLLLAGCGSSPQPESATSGSVTEDGCQACLDRGGTWQPEAEACTDACALQDISCFTDACPGRCADDCAACFGQAACEAQGCTWHVEAEAAWCT
jgi:hypothetical protein